ncbi:hypothetical protein CR51_22610 [Caballeronia megalochromosomata]|nr:hypothetical protein CR51_22610 [Caballeronia megalochromosomata]
MVALATAGVPGSNLVDSSVISGYALAHTLQVIGAGASYTFAATIGATYSNTKFKGLRDITSGPAPLTGVAGAATLNNAKVDFRYQLSLTLLPSAAYVQTKSSEVDGPSGARYHQSAMGVDYLLSKRTDIYRGGVYQKANETDSTGNPAVASISQTTPSSTDRRAALR